MSKHRFDPETFSPSDLGFTDQEAKEFVEGARFLFSHDEEVHLQTLEDAENGPPLEKLDKTHAQGPLAL